MYRYKERPGRPNRAGLIGTSWRALMHVVAASLIASIPALAAVNVCARTGRKFANELIRPNKASGDSASLKILSTATM